LRITKFAAHEHVWFATHAPAPHVTPCHVPQLSEQFGPANPGAQAHMPVPRSPSLHSPFPLQGTPLLDGQAVHFGP
jgi:hypothetical protein